MKHSAFFRRAALKPVAHSLIALPVLAGILLSSRTGLAITETPYAFQNVLIGCEGQVTGLYSHPLNGSLIYLRNDGGSYRYDSAAAAWNPIGDNLPPVSNGVNSAGASIAESLVGDPNNVSVVYAGIGGGVCRSTDQGNTWSAVHTVLNSGGQPIFQDWNGTGKNENHRIAVDPNNSAVVYYGTNRDGLFKSTDSGTTWTKITAFPTDATPGDVVAFDKGGGTTSVGGQTVSAVIYVGVSAGTSTDNGVWKSSNGGATWTHLGGFAMDVEQAMITTNGTLYVVGAGTGGVGKVARGATTITNITPSTASSYDAIAVDLTDANGNTAILANNAYCNTPGCQLVWRTTNGGTSWTNIIGTGVNPVTWSDEPGPPCRDIQALCLNSQNGQIATIGDSFGPWQTPNVTLGSPVWTVAYKGYEAMTGMWPFCPPSGAPLLTGCMDPSAYRNTAVNTFPTELHNIGGRVATIAWCETDPNYVALVSDGSYYGYTGNSGYSTSTNNMATTTDTVDPNYGGTIAVGATKQANGKPIIVRMPATTATVYRSTDWGISWSTVPGMPDDRIPFWQSQQFLCADRVNGNKFYLFDFNTTPSGGKVYRSTDGGATFSVANSSFNSAWNTGFQITGEPGGPEGKLWMNPNPTPTLFYSTDSGSTWTAVANIPVCTFFALGKPAAGHTHPALYVNGTVTIGGTNYNGIFRSDDATGLTGNLSGATWVRIWNPASGSNLPYRMNGLGADEQTYGRIYFAVGGRGFAYGDNPSGGIPPAPTGLTATAGNAQVSLSWNASSGATSYKIYSGTTSGGEAFFGATTTSTSYIATGATNGTTYYYKVTAVNAAGESGFSNEASATPSGPAPQAQIPNGTPVIDGTVDAVWNGATAYTLSKTTGTISGSSGNSSAVGSLIGALG